MIYLFQTIVALLLLLLLVIVLFHWYFNLSNESQKSQICQAGGLRNDLIQEKQSIITPFDPDTKCQIDMFKKIHTNELETDDEKYCQIRKDMINPDACNIGNGLNILTNLGLGPADQDQLNLINHKDHNNLAWILKRPLNPPRKLINDLKESTTGPEFGPYSENDLGITFKTLNACNCDVGIVNLDRPASELEGITDAMAERLVDGKTHNILYNLTPNFLRTGLKQYYGDLYYNDVRYPQRPISIEFALNPAGYCERHIQEYPCTLIASRKDIR